MKKLAHFILVIVCILSFAPNLVSSAVTYDITLMPDTPHWYDKLNPLNWFSASRATTPTGPTSGNVSGSVQNPTNIYSGSTGVAGLFSWIGSILRLILPLIISVAVVWFVYSIFQYTIRESEDDKEKAKTQIVSGIVGIFVMVSVWGLVNILQSTFNLSTSRIDAPIIRPGSF